MKTILVFGATGTLGAYVSVHFHKLGYRVLAVGHRKSDNGFFADYNIPYYSVDISKAEDFKKLPAEGINLVAHFAGACRLLCGAMMVRYTLTLSLRVHTTYWNS